MKRRPPRCVDCVSPYALATALKNGSVQHQCVVCGREWFERAPATNETDEENTTVPAPPHPLNESDSVQGWGAAG